MTLIEVIICLAIVGLLLAAASSSLLESAALSLKATRTLEHSRSARELFDRMSRDVHNAQIVVLHPEFHDRSTRQRDGETGNYLAMHSINEAGAISRTVGYYIMVAADGEGWTLYRHDSANGDSAAGVIPAPGTAGSHRVVTRSVALPNGNPLFTCVRDRGVSLHGEFGTTNEAAVTRTELIRYTVTTRS
jgi:prepilin-type N-terminal cleavage/methylation domain-containing protein